MKLREILLATTACTIAIGHDNEPGWKMDGDKLAVDANGDPIYVDSNGKEASIKHDTISNLNNEAKTHRTAKEKAEGDLAKYRDASGKLIDPTEAVKAIDTVKKIDAKQLIDAGKVDELTAQIKSEFQTQLHEKDAALAEAKGTVNSLRVDRLFDASEFVRDRVAVPPDMFRDSLSKFFKVNDDGKIEAYDRSGNRLMSKKSPGDYAEGDEAFELLVEAHPQKDTILRAPDASGTGNQGGGGNRGRGNTMKRSEFDALDPAGKVEAGEKMGKGELTITD